MILPDKMKLLLNEEEKEAVIKAIQQGDSYVVLRGQMVSLQIIPTVLTFETWYTQENEKLALSGKRLCKKCLSIMAISDKCACWEGGKGEERNAFKETPLPELVESAIKQITEKKSFPVLKNIDKSELLYREAKERLAQSRYEFYNDDGSGTDFYIDEETGEKRYS